MAGRRPREPALPTGPRFGVDEGQEIAVGDEAWPRLVPLVGTVLECALVGSSIGLGVEDDEWFAGLIQEVQGNIMSGWLIKCTLLGCERGAVFDEVARMVAEGLIHLCPADPCPHQTDPSWVHVTKVRMWKCANFDCDYLSDPGAGYLKKAATKEKRAATIAAKQAAGAAQVRAPAKTGPEQKRGRRPVQSPGSPIISLVSEEEPGEGTTGPGEISPARRGALRQTLRRTRERILGQAGGEGARSKGAGVFGGGATPSASAPAAEPSGLVAGTNLNPSHQTPLRLAAVEDLSGSTMKTLKKQLSGAGSASSALVTQALEQSVRESRNQKKRRRHKDKKDGVRQLVTLLQGKKKKKKKRNQRQGQNRVRFKKDPDGSGGSSSSEYSSGSDYSEKEASEDTDLDCEPPLRKRAAKSPGSVMELLVKHAQEQLDRGALLESEGARASLTTGIKISTYFALLIRPNHAPGSPLLRELYSLAQAIDLLRMGKLPEAADALASRFIAVHTALGDGNWLTASQLELYPLEPVQSTSTATMLEAQKHRRLVLKSQGLGGYGNRWWGGTGRGKGNYSEKGKKGEPKGKNKGKGKGQSKEQSWGSKNEANPWRENKEDAKKP